MHCSIGGNGLIVDWESTYFHSKGREAGQAFVLFRHASFYSLPILLCSSFTIIVIIVLYSYNFCPSSCYSPTISTHVFSFFLFFFLLKFTSCGCLLSLLSFYQSSLVVLPQSSFPLPNLSMNFSVPDTHLFCIFSWFSWDAHVLFLTEGTSLSESHVQFFWGGMSYHCKCAATKWEWQYEQIQYYDTSIPHGIIKHVS